MDGVLINNLECHVEVFQKLGQEHGVTLTKEQGHGVFRLINVDMFSAMTGREIGWDEGVPLDKRKE